MRFLVAFLWLFVMSGCVLKKPTANVVAPNEPTNVRTMSGPFGVLDGVEYMLESSQTELGGDLGRPRLKFWLIRTQPINSKPVTTLVRYGQADPFTFDSGDTSRIDQEMRIVSVTYDYVIDYDPDSPVEIIAQVHISHLGKPNDVLVLPLPITLYSESGTIPPVKWIGVL